MKYINDIIAECRKNNRPAISFEFFPPKSEEGVRALIEKTLPALKNLNPDYCSVTYGAGGSTRDRTLAITARIQSESGIPAMSHLTCVNSVKAEVHQVLDEARALGIQNILALRGDPPGGGVFKKTEGGCEYAVELVQLIAARKGEFCTGVAAFPEGHPASGREGRFADWQRLKEKLDAGASFALTQLFYDNDRYFEFIDYLAKLGVTQPILPGILPIMSAAQVKRFTALCGATLPADLVKKLDELGDDDEAATSFGIEFASKQCETLLRAGVPGLHFYTLNKVRSTREIMRNLGIAGTDVAN